MNKRRYSRIAAAEHLGVSISTIRRMIERGELDTERDGPRSNGKVWVLLDDHLGNPDGVPPESSGTPGNPLTVSSDPATSPNGVPDSPVGMPDGVPSGMAASPGGVPDSPVGMPDGVPSGMAASPGGVPDSPVGMPDGVPSGMAASPGGVPDLATEVVLLRQQVQHMEERVKDLEQLSQERADRLKESEWRYHELVKQVTSTMEHVTKALPPANGVQKKATKRAWWPFRRRSTTGS